MSTIPDGVEEQRIISDVKALQVYFNPKRLRIIEHLIHQPRTIHQVADLLGVPFTRLYYQFNLLEKHGFIRVVETRKLGGAVEEKYYQVTALRFVIDRASKHTMGEDRLLDTLLGSVLDDTREDIRESFQSGVLDMNQKPPHPSALMLNRAVFRLTPEQLTEFHERLTDIITALVTGPAEPENSQYYGFAVTLYPTAFMQDGEAETDET
ncbi:MAG TPA: winged helix-turn-helix domain-containing protein [Aggregatilineales bacterium]|nr:winged helix-turn-helix domain-containing protein [Aggregatilineales bacterium]